MRVAGAPGAERLFPRGKTLGFAPESPEHVEEGMRELNLIRPVGRAITAAVGIAFAVAEHHAHVLASALSAQ